MGVVLASKKPKFWLVFIISFVIFGTLLSLLSDGMGKVNFFFATDFFGKISVIKDSFLALIGLNGRAFLDWGLTFLITILQSLLIALIALVWKKKREVAASIENKSADNTLQNAGIVAGLAILGSGCPTCGTALITPILGGIFSASGYAMAETVSGTITVIAIVIALLSLKKVGEQAYVIMVDEEWRKKHRADKHTAKEKNEK